MSINLAPYADLELHIKSVADQKALQPYIGHPESAKIPGSPIKQLQEDTKFRAKLLSDSILGLLHTTILAKIIGEKVTIYQNGEWNPEFIRGLEFRTGTEFLENSYLGEGGMISSLLEYAKRHDITIGDSAKLCYTQDGVLYLERTEDTQPKPPAREPRIRAQIYRPRMAYAPNTNS